MLSELITSKARIKLLIKFFLNTETKSYLRLLERELCESSNAIRIELNRLEKLDLIKGKTVGNKKMFQGNIHHPFYNEIRSLIMKDTGLHDIKSLKKHKTDQIRDILVIGSYAEGITSNIIDLIIISHMLKAEDLTEDIKALESKTNKRIRYLIINEKDLNRILNDNYYFPL